MQVSLKKSITLVELIISVTLMGVIILGAVAFHLAGGKLLTSSETKTRVLNDLSFVLQHLQKNILTAKGSADNPGISVNVAGNTLSLIKEGTQTANYTFGVAASPNSIMFSDDNMVTWEQLTSSFIDLGAPNAFEIDIVNGGIKIANLALRLDPTSVKNDSTNPEVTTIDADSLPNPTVYFYSLAHTW